MSQEPESIELTLEKQANAGNRDAVLGKPTQVQQEALSGLIRHLELRQVYVMSADPMALVLANAPREHVDEAVKSYRWPAGVPWPGIIIQQK